MTKIEDIPLDIERDALPVPRDPNMSIADLTQLAKVIIGKDMSKFSMPVFLNEPLTIN